MNQPNDDDPRLTWQPFRIEALLPASADERAILGILAQEAEASGLLSSGLVVGDLDFHSFDAGPNATGYAMSFAAEAPLDIDHVALIMIRRLRKRFDAEGVIPLSIASVAPRRARAHEATGQAQAFPWRNLA